MKFILATAFILCGALALTAAVPTPSTDLLIPANWRQAFAAGKAVLDKYINEGETSQSDVVNALNIEEGNGIPLDNVKSILSGGFNYAMESKLVSDKTKKALSASKDAIEEFLLKSGENTTIDRSQEALGANLVKVAIGAAHDLKNGENLQDIITKRAQEALGISQKEEENTDDEEAREAMYDMWQ